ncbi:MAG TPA: hypothetical protein VFV28_04655 [Limnobacter sp.]|nr:hypothetical protein [Limnobacter sp.]
MNTSPHIVLVPDCGPLLELHLQGQLHLLTLQFAALAVPDAVIHQLVRFHGEEGKALAVWISQSQIPVLQTRTFNNGQVQQDVLHSSCERSLVDSCLLEVMKDLGAQEGQTRGVLLLDDYKCLGDSPFNSIQFCTTITLSALKRFLLSLPINQAQVPAPTHRVAAPQEKQAVFRLNALQRVNPQALEHQFRKLAEHTTQMCMKGVEVVKAGKKKFKPTVSTGPRSDLAEQFRKNLELKKPGQQARPDSSESDH